MEPATSPTIAFVRRARQRPRRAFSGKSHVRAFDIWVGVEYQVSLRYANTRDRGGQDLGDGERQKDRSVCEVQAN